MVFAPGGDAAQGHLQAGREPDTHGRDPRSDRRPERRRADHRMQIRIRDDHRLRNHGAAAPLGVLDHTDVSAPLSGLTTETTYHYRVVVHTASGVRYGEDQVYTPHRVVGLRTKAASNIGEAGATLNGEFVGNGEETHYHFEWGPTAAYGHSTTAAAVSPGNGVSEPLSAPITGLAPFSTYHFRVVANNGAGTSVGEDRMFTTPPGSLDRHRSGDGGALGSSLHAWHRDRERGTDKGALRIRLRRRIPAERLRQRDQVGGEEPIGMGKEAHTTTVPITGGLQPGTLYHYREVGVNEAGEACPPTTHLHHLRLHRRNQRSLPERPRAPADRLGPAARLPRLRARLGGQQRRLRRRVQPRRRPGPLPEANPKRRTSGNRGVLYGVHDGGIPGFRSDEPRRRPLRRDQDGARVDDRIRRDPGQRHAVDPPVQLLSAGSRRQPRHARLRRARNLLALLRRRKAPATRSICPAGNSSRGWPARDPSPSAEPAGYIGKHLSADGTALHIRLDRAARARRQQQRRRQRLRPGPGRPGPPISSPRRPAGATMTGPGIGELTSQATDRGSSSASSCPKKETQSSGTST